MLVKQGHNLELRNTHCRTTDDTKTCLAYGSICDPKDRNFSQKPSAELQEDGYYHVNVNQQTRPKDKSKESEISQKNTL